MMRWRTRIGLLGALAVAGACGESSHEPAPQGAGAGGSTATGGGTATGGDAPASCASALTLSPQTNALGGVYYEHRGVIDPAGDRDTLRFDAQAGQWFGMVTQANPEGDPSKVDTVLTLFDDSGATQLAQADSSPPVWSPDSEIIHRFAADGRYCLEVMERSEWLGQPAVGGPGLTYRLLVYPIDAELYDDWNEDQEPNDEPAAAQALTFMHYDAPFTRIIGDLGTGDADIYRIATEPETTGLLIGLTPRGPDGFGGTTGPGILQLRHDQPAGAVVAELDYQLRPAAGYQTDAYAGLLTTVDGGGAYLLEVPRPVGSPVGPNDFYVLKIWQSQRASADEEPNDDPSTASAYSYPDPKVPGLWHHHFEGQLPAGDVDWWTFSAAVNAPLEVHCASRHLGSSLRDATFALFMNECAPGECYVPAAEPLAVGTESESEPVVWSDDPLHLPTGPALVAPEDNRYWLQVTAPAHEPSIESTFYLCYVKAGAG